MICIPKCFILKHVHCEQVKCKKTFIKLYNRNGEEEDRRKVQFCRRSKSNIPIRRKYKFDTAFDKSSKDFV